MTNSLIVFIKNPVEGKVKTRLAADIGAKGALKVYQHLLDHTQKITAPLPVKKLLFYSDFIDHSDNWSESDYKKNLQTGESLGVRMENAFRDTFSKSAEKVIIIGSDCIDLTSNLIQHAFEKLNSSDVVIGPAKDGGYYLIGMKSLHAGLFQDKQWSTSKVLNQTIEECEKLGLSYFKLPVLSDIDNLEDLSSSSIPFSNINSINA